MSGGNGAKAGDSVVGDSNVAKTRHASEAHPGGTLAPRSRTKGRAVARFLGLTLFSFALTGIAFFAILAAYDLTLGRLVELVWAGPVILASWGAAWFLVDRLFRLARARRSRDPDSGTEPGS